MSMGYMAYIKATMLKPEDDSDECEICLNCGGDIDRLIKILRQVIFDISEESEVSVKTLADAIVAKDEKLFEKNLEKVISELQEKDKGFVWRIED